jgi:hypothetical protein
MDPTSYGSGVIRSINHSRWSQIQSTTSSGRISNQPWIGSDTMDQPLPWPQIQSTTSGGRRSNQPWIGSDMIDQPSPVVVDPINHFRWLQIQSTIDREWYDRSSYYVLGELLIDPWIHSLSKAWMVGYPLNCRSSRLRPAQTTPPPLPPCRRQSPKSHVTRWPHAARDSGRLLIERDLKVFRSGLNSRRGKNGTYGQEQCEISLLSQKLLPCRS